MRTASVAATIMVGAAAACTRPGRVPRPAPASSATTGAADTVPIRTPARPAPLRVENRHHADVVIYVVRGNVRTRLGTVTAGGSRDLTIPASHVNDTGGISLTADPVGGRAAARSDRIIVRSGERVVWTLESNLTRSLIAVY